MSELELPVPAVLPVPELLEEGAVPLCWSAPVVLELCAAAMPTEKMAAVAIARSFFDIRFLSYVAHEVAEDRMCGS